MISPLAPVLLLAGIAAITAAAAGYARHVVMPRPPAGRFTRSDVVIMTILLIALPFGYLHLPTPVLVSVFGLLFLAAVQTALAPVTGGRASMLIAIVGCGGVLTASLTHHPLALLWGNDLLIAVAVVGVVNLWVQTGMTAAQVAALSAVLAVYDLVATGLTSFTASFFSRISHEPFAPALAAGHGTVPVALGLGDCLMVALWPLAAAKAYGRLAGWTGAITGLAAVAVIEAGVAAGWITGNVPVLVFVGPLVVAQWAFWRRSYGRERTTGRWQSGAPARSATASRPVPAVDAALLMAASAGPAVPAGHWIAIHDGAVAGHGLTPGLARRAARQAGLPGVPVVLQSNPSIALSTEAAGP